MCYSAKVQQSLRSLAKRFGADVDWTLFEQVFHRRLQDDEINFARALEANFQPPQSEIEHRIQAGCRGLPHSDRHAPAAPRGIS